MTTSAKLVRRGPCAAHERIGHALPELFGYEGQKGAAVGVGVEVVAGVIGVENGGTAVAGGKFEAHHQMVAMENIHLGELVLGGRVVAGGRWRSLCGPVATRPSEPHLVPARLPHPWPPK
ncbi:MAG: hypothetical protein IPL28_13680 [Chloroflexi bacterium]|nr:hypothetical protein [Chloroflexota bacterium]